MCACWHVCVNKRMSDRKRKGARDIGERLQKEREGAGETAREGERASKQEREG